MAEDKPFTDKDATKAAVDEANARERPQHTYKDYPAIDAHWLKQQMTALLNEGFSNSDGLMLVAAQLIAARLISDTLEEIRGEVVDMIQTAQHIKGV